MATYTALFGVNNNVLQLTLTETVNANNNTSSIAYDVRVLGEGYNVTYNNYLRLVINGISIYDGNPGSVINNYPICSGTYVYTHNTDGTGSFPFSVYYSTVLASSGAVSASISNTFTCQTIARQSTVSASNGTLGTAQTLTVTRASSSYTHTITYKVGNTTGTIVTKSSNTSISWTPPLSLASQNTSGTTVSCVLTCTTYNGNTSLGSTQKTISLTIPSSVKPTSGARTITDVGQSTFSGVWVQNKSKARIVWPVSTASDYGATIRSATVTFGGVAYNMTISQSGTDATCTSPDIPVTSSGTVNYSMTATDTRGRTCTLSSSISVQSYSTPGITSASVVRCDSSGTASSNGTYAKIDLTCTYASVSGRNTITGTIAYLGTSETFTTTTVSKVIGGGGFSTDNSYTITVTVTDRDGSSASVNLQLPSEFVLIDFHSSGTGMAIGKVSNNANLFEVDLRTNFNKPVTQLAPNRNITDNGTFSNNQAGYLKLVEVTVKSAYCNAPFGFDFIQRTGCGTVWIQLYNSSSTEPAIVDVKSIGWLQEVQVDRSVSGGQVTFGVWVKKSENYDNLALVGFHFANYTSDKVDISLVNSYMASSPGGVVAQVYRPTAV